MQTDVHDAYLPGMDLDAPVRNAPRALSGVIETNTLTFGDVRNAVNRAYNQMTSGRTLQEGDGTCLAEWAAAMVDVWLTAFQTLPSEQHYTYMRAMFGLHRTELQRVDVKAIEAEHSQCLSPLHDLGRLAAAYIQAFPSAAATPALDFFLKEQVGMLLRRIPKCKDMLLAFREHMLLVVARRPTEVMAGGSSVLSPSFLIENEDALDPVHKLMLYVLTRLEQHQYKRMECKCYEQKYTRSGMPTRSWREACDITTFIHNMCDKETHFLQWKWIMSSRGVVEQITKRLTSTNEREFPELQVNRHLFSFINGIFDTEHLAFHPYEDTSRLGANEATVNYINANFEPSIMDNHPMDIATPTLDIIFRFQLEQAFDADADVKADPALKEVRIREVMQWVYFFLGRMFYKLHHYDQWQVVPLFKGKGGTGKSSIGKLLQDIFPREHIGILSSNIEKQFGLSQIVGKHCWLCFELKENFQLPLAELQSVISGEPVSAAVKNGNPVIVPRWDSAGMMFGNEVPNWKDVGGALLRRFIMFMFDRVVPSEQCNPNLPSELRAELGAIVPKVTGVYRMLAQQHRSRDIFGVLPKYFTRSSQKFLSALDHLSAYLNECSTTFLFRDQGMVPKDYFVTHYKQWMSNNRSASANFNFNEKYYEVAFQQRGLQMKKKVSTFLDDVYEGDWVIGIVAKECEVFCDDDDL